MFESINSYYENYDEDGRLFRDNAHKVEYLTTIHYFDRLFAPNSRILDACAGTGNYSFYLANKGHKVTACDIVEHNVNIIKAKPDTHKLEEISVCNVLDLSRFNNSNFDAVLCMGALYHVREKEIRRQAVSECVRVCKPGGVVVLAYITKVGAILANINADLSNIGGLINVLDDTDETRYFFCAYPHETEKIAVDCGLLKLHHIGVDGLCENLSGKLNAANDENFQKYMEYHYLTCEDESIIGTSIHGLWIGRKM
jgi:2-polyprenyl-3-methyl-5-hydroxy-6-metoxy-1,4-benzoquinol methylase